MSAIINHRDPTLVRDMGPVFHLERMQNVKIFDMGGRAFPAVISLWVSECEVREIKVSIKQIEFSDLDYDVRTAIHAHFGKKEIIGDIELI